MAPHWKPPPQFTIKINVAGVGTENLQVNGNENGVALIVRDHRGVYLFGRMGTLRDASAFQAQLWVIHMAMKWAFQKELPTIVIETSDIAAYEVFRNREDEEDVIEEEDLEFVIDQIEILRSRYNKSPSDGSQPRRCTIQPVVGTRNEPARRMALLGMQTCEGIVDVSVPPLDIQELLDIDNGLGPMWEMFETLPNQGLGEILTEEIVSPTLHGLQSRVKVETSVLEEPTTVREQGSLRNSTSLGMVSSINAVPFGGIVIREPSENLIRLTGSSIHDNPNDKGKRKMFEAGDVPPGFEVLASNKRRTDVAEGSSH